MLCVVLFYFSEDILISLKIEPEIAEDSRWFITRSAVAVFIEGLQLQIFGFMVGQGVIIPFLLSN